MTPIERASNALQNLIPSWYAGNGEDIGDYPLPTSIARLHTGEGR